MMLTFKKKKRDSKPLLLSPVFVPEITGVVFKVGEIIPHARMKTLVDTPSVLAGMAFTGEETTFFVASHPDVIQHIKQQGGVPLSHTHYLRFFKDKKRMNAHLSNVSSAA